MRIQRFIDRMGRLLILLSQALQRLLLFLLTTLRRVTLATLRSPVIPAVLRPLASVARVGAVAALVAYASVTGLKATTQTVLPTQVGVLQQDWGDDAGIVPEDLGPSKRFVIPGRGTLHRLDRRIHFVRFGMESEGNEESSLELRTTDDLEVRVGVTVAYRIRSGEAHRMVEDGIRSTYRGLAKSAIERVLLDALGALSRDGWASVQEREAAEAAALEEIGIALAPFHLDALGVYLSATWFPPAFEVEVMEQKLLEQRILTDAMLARRDERNHELLTERERIYSAEAARRAELEFTIDEERLQLTDEVSAIEREAAQYAFEKKTSANNAYEKAVAIGRLEIDRAEALRERLLNEALESAGGRVMIARDAARNLKFKTVKLDANNPDVPSVLDLDELARLLIGQ